VPPSAAEFVVTKYVKLERNLWTYVKNAFQTRTVDQFLPQARGWLVHKIKPIPPVKHAH